MKLETFKEGEDTCGKTPGSCIIIIVFSGLGLHTVEHFSDMFRKLATKQQKMNYN